MPSRSASVGAGPPRVLGPAADVGRVVDDPVLERRPAGPDRLDDPEVDRVAAGERGAGVGQDVLVGRLGGLGRDRRAAGTARGSGPPPRSPWGTIVSLTFSAGL